MEKKKKKKGGESKFNRNNLLGLFFELWFNLILNSRHENVVGSLSLSLHDAQNK